jgi:molybdopterin-guanine dinucleotide biosynthesis protein
MNKSNLKTIAFAAPTTLISKVAKDLKAAGYQVALDKSAGTMVAKALMQDGSELEVARALQMGRGRTWSLRADPQVIQTS